MFLIIQMFHLFFLQFYFYKLRVHFLLQLVSILNIHIVANDVLIYSSIISVISGLLLLTYFPPFYKSQFPSSLSSHFCVDVSIIDFMLLNATFYFIPLKYIGFSSSRLLTILRIILILWKFVFKFSQGTCKVCTLDFFFCIQSVFIEISSLWLAEI